MKRREEDSDGTEERERSREGKERLGGGGMLKSFEKIEERCKMVGELEMYGLHAGL